MKVEIKVVQMKTRRRKPSKTETGTYLTLSDGTEVQITGFKLIGSEGFFTVRYPDNLVSGDSYEVSEGDIYAANFSKKYSN